MPSDREAPAPFAFSTGRPARTVFQTLRMDGIRPAERFDYWQEMVIRGAELERTSAEAHPVFEGRITSLATPTGEFHQGYSSPYITRRQPRHIRRDGGEDLALYLVQEGSVRHRQDKDRDVSVMPGEFLLLDMARASESSLGCCKLIELDLSPCRLRDALGTIPAPSLVTDALRASKLAPLIRTHLAALPEILETMSEAEQAFALRATEDFAVSILQGAFFTASGAAFADANKQPSAHALFLAASRLIDSELSHPHLGAAMVARALGCSRATLYRAFACNGQSVGQYIRRMRLARLRRLLEQSPPTASIAELAARCGLYDTPNLNRMFRAEFAMTPSQARRQAAGPATPSPSRGG
jgi:AraC-like DNA-binding protein